MNRHTGSWPAIAVLLIADVAVVAAVAIFAWWVKSLSDPHLSIDLYLRLLPALLAVMAVAFAGLGLYPGIGFAAHEELRRLSIGMTLVFLGAIASSFLLKGGELVSRQICVSSWALALLCVPLARAAVRRMCAQQPWWGLPCAILGAGRTGTQVVGMLQKRPWLGLRPVAVLDDDAALHGSVVGGITVEGPIVERASALAALGVRHNVLVIPGMAPDRLARLLDQLGDHVRHVYIAPALPSSPDVIAEAREFANTMVLEVRQNLLHPGARAAKRMLDILGVLAGSIVVLPLVGLFALMIKLGSRGPVFYGQRRIGRGGREFKAWKFRSMVADADVQLKIYLERHPELREEWERDHKLKDDPRVTWVGKLLRRTSLDELPQLWNIFCGEMSLVGPRPIVSAEIPKYGERFVLYQKVRPGLSGLWQVSGRNDTTYAERVALDCYYVRNWSVWIDLVILARTVRVVVFGKGAY
ncbi:MAG: undecaprenyl-phosphate galactose phosphotransferase WbaP [Planctomycetota bacterium]